MTEGWNLFSGGGSQVSQVRVGRVEILMRMELVIVLRSSRESDNLTRRSDRVAWRVVRGCVGQLDDGWQ